MENINETKDVNIDAIMDAGEDVNKDENNNVNLDDKADINEKDEEVANGFSIQRGGLNKEDYEDIISKNDEDTFEKNNKVCKICNGTGKVKSDLGIEVKCKCQLESSDKQIKKVAYTSKSKKETDVMTRMLSLIPEGREDDEFKLEVLEQRVLDTYYKNGYKVVNFNTYKDLLVNILMTIQGGKSINSSYLIGAPNGMSKTTFANTLIKIGYSKGLRMVPYVSLLEINDKFNKHNGLNESNNKYSYDGANRKNNGYIKGDKVQEEEESKYSSECSESIREYRWNDFVNCDLLITTLSDNVCANIEIPTLKRLLKIRARMNKPIIVFIDCALSRYLYNQVDYEVGYFTREYISNIETCGYNRLYYTSCYLNSMKNPK